MLIEMGNHSPVHAGPDDRPKVTTINIPEFDAAHIKKMSDPSDERMQLGHYGHKIGGINPAAFRAHRADAADYNNGVTNLGQDCEALLAIVAAWPTRGTGRPAWINVTGPADAGTDAIGRHPDTATDIEKFLSDYYEVPTMQDYFRTDDVDEAHIKKELNYWTNKGGAPGELPSGLTLPPLEAVYTVDGRIMNNLNDGGDTSLVAANSQGVGTAASATVLTTSSTLVGTTNIPGHRIVVYTLSGNVFVYGNVISNVSGAAGTITVDQWYVPATPGGSAGANPGTPWAWVVLDGGFVSTWFAAWGYGGTPTVTNTDHTLATGGQTEYTQAGGTAIRKICPTATDVSASTRTVTLVPVFTANATDVGSGSIGTHPMDIVGFFASMVTTFGGAGGPMKFEDVISPTATMASTGDNVTVTEVITGSVKLAFTLTTNHGGASSGSVASVAVGTVVSGDLMVLWVRNSSSSSATISAVSDTVGTTYTWFTKGDSTAGTCFSIIVGVLAGSGADTVTITWSAQTGGHTMWAEFSGSSCAGAALDVAHAAGIHVTASPCVTPTVTTGGADNLVLSCVYTTTALTVVSPWLTAAVGATGTAMGYQADVAAGTYTPDMTATTMTGFSLSAAVFPPSPTIPDLAAAPMHR